VPLGVTVVPTWSVTNPTSSSVTFAPGQPQVLDGCCPGPVYVDDELLEPGALVEVPPAGAVELAFPLQMHPGMDGPHHLAIPLTAEDGAQETALHVTGDFRADAAT
jgi:hypothetical protein